MNTWMRNTPILSKLVLLFLVISVVPLVAVGVYSYTTSVENITTQIANSRLQSLELVSTNIAAFLDEIDRTATAVMLDSRVQEHYANPENAGSYADTMALGRDLGRQYLGMSRAISAIRFSPYQGVTVNVGGTSFQFSTSSNLQQMEQRLSQAQAGDYVCESFAARGGTNPMMISLIRRAYQMQGVFKPLGIVEVQFPADELAGVYKSIYKQGGETKNGIIAVLNTENQLIVSSDEKFTQAILPHLQDFKFETGSGHGFFEFENSRYLVSVTTLNHTNWRLFDIVPHQELMSAPNNVKDFTLSMLCLSVVCSVLFSALLYFLLIQPIHSLITGMRTVEEGNLDVSLATRRKDEIGQLSNQFTRMLEQIKLLLLDVEQKEAQKNKAELSALQAQITPHFLYNTLNSIKCLAALQQCPDVEKMAGSLINLLKINVEQTGWVKLADELQCVREYCELQHYRYGDAFTLNLLIAQELCDEVVPKLLLQPLVENCFIHGFDFLQGDGIITITGKATEQELLLCVADNGIGMSALALDKIKQEMDTKSNYHKKIGLSNVDERIKLYYGAGYGIEVDSRPSQGTKNFIRLPKTRTSKED